MKTRENVETTAPQTAPVKPKAKARSLRPMRSLVAVRSFKPRTGVATMILKPETSAQ